MLRTLLWGLAGLLPSLGQAVPQDFDLPGEALTDALLAFSQQARIEILFSFDELRTVRSTEVKGRCEPEAALDQLLRDTGFVARAKSRGKFVIKPVARVTGSLRGRLLTTNGGPASGVHVALPEIPETTVTDDRGEFRFATVAPGTYRLTATGSGFRPLQLTGLHVVASRTLALETQTLLTGDNLTVLEPFIVEGTMSRLRPLDRGRIALSTRLAGGNLDLPRSENDPLPYRIYEREQIARSGVVNLGEFFALEVLDNEGAAPAPQLDGSRARKDASFATSDSSLNLRGYSADQTVVLVNGRRLPESPPNAWGELAAPDVNFIPLSLVQQIEILPVSASALYSGNAVGGVVNIVLRPDINGSEVTATYTNALRGFSAPQSTLSLQHGETLLGGALRLRFNASFTRITPPTEAQLGYHTAHVWPVVPLTEPVYRATPNIRSVDGLPLLGPGSSSVTSVAPGADGLGGLAAFAGRAGVRNFDWFEVPGRLAASANSREFPYGNRERRSAYFGSVTYDVTPRLQLGFDAAYANTVVNRGFEVLNADLNLAADSPLNPFGKDVKVSLNEIVPRLGEDYSEVRIDYFSAVLGVLLKLPADWRVAFDAQCTNNLAKYRGLAGFDTDRWQELVDQGSYNPLRDTQVQPPPDAFYDRVLKYYNAPGHFVTMSDYSTVDAAVRITNQSLGLPTGRGTVCVGGDYRQNHLGGFNEVQRYADGTPASDPASWAGRTLERLSAFAELRAPLLPTRWLPRWMHGVETDLAARYIVADTSQETNVAPAAGLRIDLAGGFALRGSVATSNRYPTPWMSHLRAQPGAPGDGGPAGPPSTTSIIDPRRNESYGIQTSEVTNPNLLPESAVTRTFGAAFERGQTHRVRLAVDFVDTRKVNEQVPLDPQTVINLEQMFPTWVERSPLDSGDAHSAGRISSVTWGAVNLAWRHSQNWTTSLDYAWTQCRGGTLELYGRWIYFQSYDRQVWPNSAVVDELRAPDGTAGALRKLRANFGASWSNRQFGFGMDGHYFHSRMLPLLEQVSLGRSRITPYWQFDSYLQSDLGRWLPWKGERYGLRGQIRVNNVFNSGYPTYNAPSSPGVQAYGDWRGRTYSVSLTATF